MKILLDMNLSPDWISVLDQSGFQAVHWSTLGAIWAEDTEIMEFAREHGFAILTHDLDFGTLLASSHAAAPSVIQIRADDVFPHSIGTQVVAALNNLSQELSKGALVTVDPYRTRLRVLPFGFRDKSLV